MRISEGRAAEGRNAESRTSPFSAARLVADSCAAASQVDTPAALAACLSPLVKGGWCGTARLALFSGDAAIVIGHNGAEERVPRAGSSLEEARRGVYVDNGIGKYSALFDERALAEQGHTAYVCAPLAVAGAQLGALCLARREAFAPDDVALASALASAYACALARANAVAAAEAARSLADALLAKSARVVIVASAEGAIIDANMGAQVSTGYSRAELVRMALPQIFGPAPFPAEGRTLVRATRKNGDERVLDLACSRASRGANAFIVLTGDDATGTSAASCQGFQDIIESLPDIIFTIDHETRVTSLNEGVATSLGRSRDSLMGLPLGTVVYDQDYKALGDALISPRDIRGIELRLRTGDGGLKWFELRGRCLRDSSGKLLGVTGVLRDIHERKKASEDAALLANVLESSSDAIIVADTQWSISFWNKAAEKLFGYSKAEIGSRSAYDLYPEAGRGELDSLIRKLNALGSVADHEAEMVRRGGEAVLTRVSASALRDEEGAVTAYALVLKDLTAQKRAEEAEGRQRALEARNRNLREMEREKSEFVSSVSHELRTPLTNIHGYSSLLVDGAAGALNAEQSKYASIIHSETERLTRLINDLLDRSRMERGKFKISPVLFDLKPIVEKYSALTLAEKKGLTVAREFADGIPQVYGDPERLGQVLLNFVSNALKFTEAGGVTVRVFPIPRLFVRVEVTDTGPGISEEDQKKLFKPFSQVASQAGQRKGGSGLGLSISKEIIRLHGGDIGVSSEPGKGSTFWFTVRTQPKKERRKAPAPA